MGVTVTSYALATRVLERMGNLSPVQSETDTIDLLIDAVSRAFDNYVFGPGLNGFVWTVDVVEFHDGGATGIVLDRLLSDDDTLRGAVVVVIDGDTLVQGTDFMVDEFPSRTLRKINGADKFGSVFDAGLRNVKITYRPAYFVTGTGTDIAPEDINRACEEETIRAYKAGNEKSSLGGYIGVTQRTPDDGTIVSYTVDEWSKSTRDTLHTYKNRLGVI